MFIPSYSNTASDFEHLACIPMDNVEYVQSRNTHQYSPSLNKNAVLLTFKISKLQIQSLTLVLYYHPESKESALKEGYLNTTSDPSAMNTDFSELLQSYSI